MGKRTIIGVLLSDRVGTATEVQQVFTDFGCNIKTRIGLHDAGNSTCDPSGLILLEVFGDEAQLVEMESKLGQITGVKTQRMIFEY